MENKQEAMKRKHLRVIADMEIEVCQLPGDGAEADILVLSCTARDISGGGVSFYGNMLYPEYSLLRLRIPMNGEPIPEKAKAGDIIKVMGKVMWSRKKKDDAKCYATGVQFLNIYESDFQVLKQFVQENISS